MVAAAGCVSGRRGSLGWAPASWRAPTECVASEWAGEKVGATVPVT